MYRTQGYPVDPQLRSRKAHERAEWRRRTAAKLRQLLTALPVFARA